MIGIDFGKKRIGIAIKVENIAIPYSIVERHKIIDELKKIIKERNIKTIILGNPLNMDGSLSEISKKVLEFEKKIKEFFPQIETILVDERLSSFEASFVNNNYGEKDDIAASIILNSYLTNFIKK
ncbi:MAG: Holliday junction resolvase RuvX [Candidatus Gracilibacteria bacterium]|nr:Holliday junction resolvase RuvX [Candidatus Gracilibacteria bacterium]